MLFNWVLPITPPQILWVNMVTAVTLALAIGFERSEANVMLRPPRPYRQGLITLNLLYRTLLVGTVGAATVFALFSWRAQWASTEEARSLAVNALVLFQIFYLLSARTLNDAVWHKRDRKSTRLNSSHVAISYVVFCLNKKSAAHKTLSMA